ncbi:hypothetical protein R0K17_31930, partial [Planococcus sp. SIMBA_143]
EWQVQTFDEGGKLSPWSRLEVFYAADKSNMPEFVTPQDGGSISDPKPTIMFVSVAQAQYEFEVLSGGSLVHNVSEET